MIYKGLGSLGFRALLWLALVLLASPIARAQSLFDASLGTLPEAQGWSYAAIGSVTRFLTNNSVLFDTTATTGTQGGWSEASGAALNRTGGFTLLFNVLINSETHVSTNRAGFSIIVLGNDEHGIELGFWTNTIFAQTDTPLFTHGEDTSFSTTNAFVNYAMSLFATNYVLTANGTNILSGPVRDYTAFNGFPNPYRTPNFIFVGDDTTSASASVNLRAVTLILPPTLTMATSGVISWIGVSNQAYTVQASTNLTAWATVGTATSQVGAFHFTNSLSKARQFFRVAFP